MTDTLKGDRPESAFLPRGGKWWNQRKDSLKPKEVIQKYKDGFVGAFPDPEAKKEYREFISRQEFGNPNGDEVLQNNNLFGTGEGKLVLPFQIVERLLPGCWPGAAQERGDCVSHSTKNAALVTMCCDIASGKPDEVTGKLEGVPHIPPEGIKDGALSTEAIYWYRGYSGDGWSCSTAARVACTKAGLWLRMPYPDLDVDLTRYSGSLAGKYGRSAPPSEFTNYGKEHLIRTSTETDSEGSRDFLANGYGITTCGGEGWSSKRDENGFSKRSGSWSHALAYIGYDDRDIIKEKYGQALILILNSWGRWNSGGRRILGTDIDIPEGSFWAKLSDCRNRDCYSFSGAMGWPSKVIPGWDLLVG